MLNKFRQTLYDWRRKRFGRYIIQNPQPIAAAAPYTYYLPPTEFLEALAVGDIVKLIFESIPISYEYGAERMWVIVTERNGEDLVGTLDNDPFDIPQLNAGDSVTFKTRDIIDIDWNDEALEQRGLKRTRSSYWDRCMVDSVVVRDGVPVQYVYREEPDLTQEGDKHPDSGWRIRGDVSLMTDAQCENESADYIALGAVLNADDSWLHLIDSPVGSQFFKNPETDEFEIDTSELT